jgi:hypothetical protein
MPVFCSSAMRRQRLYTSPQNTMKTNGTLKRYLYRPHVDDWVSCVPLLLVPARVDREKAGQRCSVSGNCALESEQINQFLIQHVRPSLLAGRPPQTQRRVLGCTARGGAKLEH